MQTEKTSLLVVLQIALLRPYLTPPGPVRLPRKEQTDDRCSNGDSEQPGQLFFLERVREERSEFLSFFLFHQKIFCLRSNPPLPPTSH